MTTPKKHPIYYFTMIFLFIRCTTPLTSMITDSVRDNSDTMIG